jgi:hypothetical protein
VAPLGDGEGRKNIKFHYFFGQSRTPVPTIKGVCAHRSNAQCALKTSRWKFFGATFFSKKVAKQNQSHTTTQPLNAQCAQKNTKLRQDLFPYYYYIFQYFEMAEFFMLYMHKMSLYELVKW